MSQRMYAKTECDACGKVERREQSTKFVLPVWRYVRIGYFGSDAFVPEVTKLLCDRCVGRVHVAMETAYAKAAT